MSKLIKKIRQNNKNTKFRIGAYVTGSEDIYSITTSKSICRILYYSSDDTLTLDQRRKISKDILNSNLPTHKLGSATSNMVVEVIRHKKNIDVGRNKFWVNSKFFKLVKKSKNITNFNGKLIYLND